MNDNLDIKGSETPILIVDDNIQYTSVLQKILERSFGYKNIKTAECPLVAAELLDVDNSPYRLIFVDYHFPDGQTGGALLKLLFERNRLNGKIAFLITSEPNSDNVKEVQNYGVYGVVAKPFNRQVLEQQIEKARRLIAVDTDDSFVIE